VGGKHVLFNYTQALVNPATKSSPGATGSTTKTSELRWRQMRLRRTDRTGGFRLDCRDDRSAHHAPHPHRHHQLSQHPSGACSPMKNSQSSTTSRRSSVFICDHECYSHFLYDGGPYSSLPSPVEIHRCWWRNRIPKAYAMNRLSHRLWARPGAGDRRHDEAQSHSTSNPTSIAQKAAVERSAAPELRSARCSRNIANGDDFVIRALRQSRRTVPYLPERSTPYPNVRAAFERGGMKTPSNSLTSAQEEAGRCRRSLRHQRSCPPVLRDLNARTRARTRPHPQFVESLATQNALPQRLA